MCDNNAVHNILLEVLVSKVHAIGLADRPRQPFLKNNSLPTLQVETGSARLKMIDLEKSGGSSTISDKINQGAEAVPVDIVEVQRMINSALKKRLKFPKFIHLYPAFVERFEYPKGFKILNFSLFAGESSLSSL
ncbi:hypothetical protein EV2_035285 [Malus domestica]